MEFFRNWKQICKITDLHLRLALALIEDQKLLDGLRRGFPRCFSDKPTTQPFVPASALRERAREIAIRDGMAGDPLSLAWESNMGWYNLGVLEEFGIPKGPRWNHEDESDCIPREVTTQLIGQIIGSGMTVTWQDQTYLASYLYCIADDRLGEIFQAEDVERVTILQLIPAKFVDLSS